MSEHNEETRRIKTPPEHDNKLEIVYDTSYNTDENNKSIGICRATLRMGDRLIERIYKIAENGSLTAQRNFIFDGEFNGKNYDNYKFHSGKAVEYLLEYSLGTGPTYWLKEDHEDDPELEFEFYDEKFEEEIEE